MSPARKWTIIAAILVLVGIALRVRTFQLDNSLWLDESSLALNILSRSFWGLLMPLESSQGAPILFLWLEKFIVLITNSSSEYALRLVPLLSGSAACAGFWFLCQRFKLSSAGSLCATALFSFSPGLIHYSGEAKQYSTDVLTAIVLYLASVRFLEKPSWRNSIVYGIVGLVSIGISHPAVFVLAGVGATVLFDGWRKHDRRRLVVQSANVCVWLIGFAFNFFFFLRHLSHIPGMVDYWQKTYQPFMPLSLQGPEWLLHAGVDIANTAGLTPILILPVAVIGVILLWRLDWRIPTMLYLPVALAILASVLRQYPFADRMALFAVPAVFICAGAAFSAMFSFPRRFTKPMVLAMFCILIFAPVKRAAALAIYPERFRMEEFRDTFLDVVGAGRCEDHILIYERAANHYRYYNRFRWSGKYTVPVVTASQLATSDSFSTFWIHFAKPSDSDVSSFKDPPCFWLVFAHTSDSEASSLSNSLAARGYTETATIRRPGASAHLFAF